MAVLFKVPVSSFEGSNGNKLCLWRIHIKTVLKYGNLGSHDPSFRTLLTIKDLSDAFV